MCTICVLTISGMYACQNFVSEIAKIRFKDFFTYLTLLSAKPFDVGENLAIEIFSIPNEFKTSRKVLLEKHGPLSDKIFLTLKKGKIAYLKMYITSSEVFDFKGNAHNKSDKGQTIINI